MSKSICKQRHVKYSLKKQRRKGYETQHVEPTPAPCFLYYIYKILNTLYSIFFKSNIVKQLDRKVFYTLVVTMRVTYRHCLVSHKNSFDHYLLRFLLFLCNVFFEYLEFAFAFVSTKMPFCSTINLCSGAQFTSFSIYDTSPMHHDTGRFKHINHGITKAPLLSIAPCIQIQMN